MEWICSCDSPVRAVAVQDDLVDLDLVAVTLVDFYLSNALDLGSVLQPAEYLMVYPNGNTKKKNFKHSNEVASTPLTAKFNGPFNGQPFVSDIAPSRSKMVEISNRLFGSTWKQPLITS